MFENRVSACLLDACLEVGFVGSADRESGSEWSAHHDHSSFDGDMDAEHVGVLVQAVHWAVDAVFARVHQRGLDEGIISRATLAQHSPGIDEGTIGAGVKVVNACAVIEEPKNNLRASHLALLAPDAGQNLPSEPCGESHRGS